MLGSRTRGQWQAQRKNFSHSQQQIGEAEVADVGGHVIATEDVRRDGDFHGHVEPPDSRTSWSRHACAR
jgi:hypothetical protein